MILSLLLFKNGEDRIAREDVTPFHQGSNITRTSSSSSSSKTSLNMNPAWDAAGGSFGMLFPYFAVVSFVAFYNSGNRSRELKSWTWTNFSPNSSGQNTIDKCSTSSPISQRYYFYLLKAIVIKPSIRNKNKQKHANV